MSRQTRISCRRWISTSGRSKNRWRRRRLSIPAQTLRIAMREVGAAGSVFQACDGVSLYRPCGSGGNVRLSATYEQAGADHNRRQDGGDCQELPGRGGAVRTGGEGGGWRRVSLG